MMIFGVPRWFNPISIPDRQLIYLPGLQAERMQYSGAVAKKCVGVKRNQSTNLMNNDFNRHAAFRPGLSCVKFIKFQSLRFSSWYTDNLFVWFLTRFVWWRVSSGNNHTVLMAVCVPKDGLFYLNAHQSWRMFVASCVKLFKFVFASWKMQSERLL